MYKFTENPDVVIHLEDGARIPRGHRWFYEYEQWLEGGNTPEPADIVDYTAINIAGLWQSAHDYEFAQISGSAIGLLALGVAAGRPKALAVQGWVHSIWSLYYERKAQVTGGPIGSAHLDFSGCGEIPHTVPELMAEMGY